MKQKVLLILMLFPLFGIAQVGISTTDPKATLDIQASNVATPANNDGILIPRVNALPATNPTVDQDRMLLYLTTTSGTYEPGFYYWDNANSIWKGFGQDKEWSLLGNLGTNPATHFVGTRDNNDLVFKRNNVTAGRLGNSNVAFGANSNPNFTGTNNYSFGEESLFLNISGIYNNAFGYRTLYSNTTGSNNMASGYRALFSNTIGHDNNAIGYEAMHLNTNGNYNIATGFRSLYIG